MYTYAHRQMSLDKTASLAYSSYNAKIAEIKRDAISVGMSSMVRACNRMLSTESVAKYAPLYYYASVMHFADVDDEEETPQEDGVGPDFVPYTERQRKQRDIPATKNRKQQIESGEKPFLFEQKKVPIADEGARRQQDELLGKDWEMGDVKSSLDALFSRGLSDEQITEKLLTWWPVIMLPIFYDHIDSAINELITNPTMIENYTMGSLFRNVSAVARGFCTPKRVQEAIDNVIMFKDPAVDTSLDSVKEAVWAYTMDILGGVKKGRKGEPKELLKAYIGDVLDGLDYAYTGQDTQDKWKLRREDTEELSGRRMLNPSKTERNWKKNMPFATNDKSLGIYARFSEMCVHLLHTIASQGFVWYLSPYKYNPVMGAPDENGQETVVDRYPVYHTFKGQPIVTFLSLNADFDRRGRYTKGYPKGTPANAFGPSQEDRINQQKIDSEQEGYGGAPMEGTTSTAYISEDEMKATGIPPNVGTYIEDAKKIVETTFRQEIKKKDNGTVAKKLYNLLFNFDDEGKARGNNPDKSPYILRLDPKALLPFIEQSEIAKYTRVTKDPLTGEHTTFVPALLFATNTSAPFQQKKQAMEQFFNVVTDIDHFQITLKQEIMEFFDHIKKLCRKSGVSTGPSMTALGNSIADGIQTIYEEVQCQIIAHLIVETLGVGAKRKAPQAFIKFIPRSRNKKFIKDPNLEFEVMKRHEWDKPGNKALGDLETEYFTTINLIKFLDNPQLRQQIEDNVKKTLQETVEGQKPQLENLIHSTIAYITGNTARPSMKDADDIMRGKKKIREDAPAVKSKSKPYKVKKEIKK